MGSTKFADRVHARIIEGLMGRTPARRDHLRDEFFGPPPLAAKVARRLVDGAFRVTGRAGLMRWTPPARQLVMDRVETLQTRLPAFEPLYQRLVDSRSRDLLVELLAFRTLGPCQVTLSRSTPAYWQAYRHIDRFQTPGQPVQAGRTRLLPYRVSTAGGAVVLHTHPLGVLNTFVLEQYACRRDGFVVEAAPGDTVIDGGGGIGDTALYFADRVGPHGRVHVFEFGQPSLRVLRANLAANASLEPRVDVVENAMWSHAGERLGVAGEGAGTSVVAGADSAAVTSESLDSLVAGGRVRRVDMIKLDIEGAECRAVQGAATTIRTMRPKLAISAYHREDDFETIPAALDATGVRYRFALDHFTVHNEETVLFGLPE